jgi:hypothetical protein
MESLSRGLKASWLSSFSFPTSTSIRTEYLALSSSSSSTAPEGVHRSNQSLSSTESVSSHAEEASSTMVGATVSTTGPVIGETKILSKANVRPLLFCSLAVFGAITYGYDGTYFTSILQMEKFNRDFGVPTVGANGVTTYVFPSSQKAVVTSIVQAGEFVIHSTYYFSV